MACSCGFSHGFYFYPRPPRGGRPLFDIEPEQVDLDDFYPRPPRGGRPVADHRGHAEAAISIHALREEGDTCARQACTTLKISIHALREEGDYGSTVANMDAVDFYPRPPRGGRLHEADMCAAHIDISIHALREEGDEWQDYMRTYCEISIHALREEGDVKLSPWPAWSSYFYPRPPRGGRHPSHNGAGMPLRFLSTPSARRATSASPR